MNPGPDPDALPQATVVPRRRARLSMVWALPIFAALVAIGVAVQRIAAEGPAITIEFKSAEGIEAGKTPIKYKDVAIGQVSAVELSPDLSRVVVTARIVRSAAALMVDGAKFWVVSPRIGLSGVSGLGTLLSGNYIGFEAAAAPGERTRRFTALEVAPVVSSTQPGRQFVLHAPDLGSLGVGSPLYFRRLPAGQVVSYALAPDGKTVQLTVFVNAPFDRWVGRDTRFWNASGIDMSLTANGLKLRTESLAALLAGGVAFETPALATDTQPAPAGTAFTLFGDATTAMKQPDALAARYVLYFDESLRGLSFGAPVTLRGLTVGEVTDIGLEFDPKSLQLRGRVEIITSPQRFSQRLRDVAPGAIESLLRDPQQRHALISALVERRGLRAQLRTGNLLTGQVYVAFEFQPGAPRATVDWKSEPVQLPVVPSALGDLEQRLARILARVDAIPFDAIGGEAKTALASINTLVRDADQAIKRLDNDVIPAVKPALEAFRNAAAAAEQAIRAADASLLGADTPAQQELRQALQEVTRAARALRVLADYLETNPAALIRGKADKP